MPQKSAAERALAHAISNVPASTTLTPGPALALSTPKTAIRRCCAAWQRAFNAYVEQRGKGDGLDKLFAAIDAGEAYCNAMPMLAGQDGVRDFLACVAHGILIGAIPHEKSSHLIAAARVTLAANQRERKPQNPSPS
jgi:hypothetical protein